MQCLRSYRVTLFLKSKNYANHVICTQYNHVLVKKDHQRYMENWVGGVMSETYHKIQIVSCSSVKIISCKNTFGVKKCGQVK